MEPEVAATALKTFGTALETVWGQVSTCISTITSQPVLMLPIAVSFAAAILGLAKGFLRFGRRR